MFEDIHLMELCVGLQEQLASPLPCPWLAWGTLAALTQGRSSVPSDLRCLSVPSHPYAPIWCLLECLGVCGGAGRKVLWTVSVTWLSRFTFVKGSHAVFSHSLSKSNSCKSFQNGSSFLCITKSVLVKWLVKVLTNFVHKLHCGSQWSTLFSENVDLLDSLKWVKWESEVNNGGSILQV